MGQSIPFACQDWANAKGAYRFLSNDRVNEADILAGHFQSTRDRAGVAKGLIFVLHDTTEFTFQREDSSAIGITKSVNSGRDKAGRVRSHAVCGILMHSSLALTTEGLPLGLAAVKVWTRKKFKGTAALKKNVNPTRVPIEKTESIRWLDNLEQSTELLGGPGRCVHIGDRESDIYELFCLAHELGTHFLLRTCVNRRAGDGDHTVADEMAEVIVKKRMAMEYTRYFGRSSSMAAAAALPPTGPTPAAWPDTDVMMTTAPKPCPSITRPATCAARKCFSRCRSS
jgi:hypothetical protein